MSFEPEAIRAFEHAGWQRAASTYGNSFAHATVPYIAPLLEAAEISPGQHVLDVACGPGHLAAAACARGATAHGLDFSAEMVAIARSAHPEVVVTEGDAENLPYPDNTFHAVVSSFGIHHVPRPELALAECRRVLKPGARIAFTVWATPEENTAWLLVFDAVARHGDRSASKAPPPGALNRIDQCVRVLEAAAFVERSAQIALSGCFGTGARCSLRSRPAQHEWQRSSQRKNHQRLPPLRMTSTVRPNVSAATKISRFPLQQYWRGVARPQTDEKASSDASGVCLGSFADIRRG